VTLEQRHSAKTARTNRRESYTAIVTFVSLAIAAVFDFREDVEMLVALQGALIAVVHRALS
jgi:hypothetical protein